MLRSEQIVKIKTLTHQGIRLYEQQQYSNALTLFEQALCIYPKWIIALQYKCLCQIELAATLKESKQVIPTLVSSVDEINKILSCFITDGAQVSEISMVYGTIRNY